MQDTIIRILVKQIESNELLNLTIVQAISTNQLQLLADVLQENTSVKRIEINTPIGDVGAKILGQMLLTNKFIDTIILNSTQIYHGGAAYIAESILNNKNSKINVLNLKKNELGNKGVIHLANFLSLNPNIIELNIANNKVKDEGAIAIINSLKTNDKLTHLHLDGNLITKKVADLFVEGFIDGILLKSLNLNYNCISSKHAMQLRESAGVHSSKLQLSFNKDHSDKIFFNTFGLLLTAGIGNASYYLGNAIVKKHKKIKYKENSDKHELLIENNAVLKELEKPEVQEEPLIHMADETKVSAQYK